MIIRNVTTLTNPNEIIQTVIDYFKKDKFKWVKQHDSMQCGVACLAMICRHYGKEYSLEYLDS